MLLPCFWLLLLPRILNSGLAALPVSKLDSFWAFVIASALYFVSVMFASIDVPLIRKLTPAASRIQRTKSLVFVGSWLPGVRAMVCSAGQ